MAPADGSAPAAAIDSAEDGFEVTRRLSDKILQAFTHAYAIGELAIAGHLREVLVKNEALRPGETDRRERYDPLGQADLWVAFVEARNRYKSMSEGGAPDPAAEAEALETMKEAYKRWSRI